MYNETYLGIIKPRFLNEWNEMIDDTKYISIKLFEDKKIKYYEVVFHNENIDVFLGKYYNDDSIFNVSHKNGNILVHNDKFDYNHSKIQIVEVLALYNILDNMFYYCTQEAALKLYDVNIDSSHLKNKNKKILRSYNRKKIDNSNFFDNTNDINNEKDNDSEIIDISSLISKCQNNSKFIDDFDKQETKIIKFTK